MESASVDAAGFALRHAIGDIANWSSEKKLRLKQVHYLEYR
jgi:hypothetical protein